jgi:hypothetical protein
LAHFFFIFQGIVQGAGNAFGLRQAEYAGVAELVDALDLGSSALWRESSSLSFRTI